MKNQNDLILLIVAFVVLVGGTLTFYFTKPEPTKPSPPTAVDISPPTLPSAAVVYSNSIGGGGSRTAGGRPAPMGGMGGGAGAPAMLNKNSFGAQGGPSGPPSRPMAAGTMGSGGPGASGPTGMPAGAPGGR